VPLRVLVLFGLVVSAEPLEPLTSSLSEATMEDELASSESFNAIFQKIN
jgi:hypothetical protein